jgi:cholesterol oxidase
MLDGHVPDKDGAVLGTGVLRISIADLARQLTTVRTTGPDGAAAVRRFGRFFLGGLWSLYATRK